MRKALCVFEAVSFFVCSCLQASVNLIDKVSMTGFGSALSGRGPALRSPCTVIQAVIASGFHLFPFRTEKLSPSAPMVLHTRGRVGRRRLFRKGSPSVRLDWRASSFIIRFYSTCILLSLLPRMWDGEIVVKGGNWLGD